MLIPNCLTQEECSILEKSFFNYIKQTNCNEEKDGVLNNTEGFVAPFKTLNISGNVIFNRLSVIVNEQYNNYVYSHSYIRIYKNSSYLKAHTDGPGRDLTLTVNVGGVEDWPIFFSNITLNHHLIPREENYEETLKSLKKDCYSIVTPRGYGYLADGLHHPHWRDPLQCKDEEYVLQLFFHWRKV